MYQQRFLRRFFRSSIHPLLPYCPDWYIMYCGGGPYETTTFFPRSCKSSISSSLSLYFFSSLSSTTTVCSIFFVLLVPETIRSDCVSATSEMLLIRCDFLTIVPVYSLTPVSIVEFSSLR